MDGISLIDAGVVGVVIAITQLLKKYIAERWVPLVPFFISLALAVPVTILHHKGIPTLSVFLSMILLEGLKIGALASASFKVAKTTVLGR